MSHKELTQAQAAARLNISVGSLRNFGKKGIGPTPRIVLPNRGTRKTCYYSASEVDAFAVVLEQNNRVIKETISITDAALHLGVSRDRLYDWIRARALGDAAVEVTIGGQITHRFYKDKLNDLFVENETPKRLDSTCPFAAGVIFNGRGLAAEYTPVI